MRSFDEREKRTAEAGLRRAVDLLVERAHTRAGREGWSLLSAELRYSIACRELVEELVTTERPKVVALRRDRAREIRAIAGALERAYYAGRFG